MCICIYYIPINVCMYRYINVYTYRCIYVYMYICIYICLYVLWSVTCLRKTHYVWIANLQLL